jgi:aconitate hydratase
VASVIHDPVTTTDELIPSGETSSFRSNPERLSQFALSRRDPGYVERAKNVRAIAKETADDYIKSVAGLVDMDLTAENTSLASVVCAKRPGDGSAREQAASCQKVLGGGANIALEYATKRYRSNLVNWGMLPFIADEETFNLFEVGDRVVVKDILSGLSALNEAFSAVLVKKDGTNVDIQLTLPKLQGDERDIIVDGCLINYYAAH